jgi:hypothetical protein
MSYATRDLLGRRRKACRYIALVDSRRKHLFDSTNPWRGPNSNDAVALIEQKRTPDGI